VTGAAKGQGREARSEATHIASIGVTSYEDFMDGAIGVAETPQQIPDNVIGAPAEAAPSGRPWDDPGASDEVPEGCIITEERCVIDVWGEVAARRALGFVAIRRIGLRLSTVRINPFPIDGTGRDLHWVCFGPQDEVDDWRTSDNGAFAVLVALERWLDGAFLNFGAAMAASVPLSSVNEALMECLSELAREVLQRRTAGETLEEIARDHGVTRERIRQIETGAVNRLTLHILALRAVQHPAALTLFGHTQRLATVVLEAASREDVVLLEDTKRHWIRKALDPDDAATLLILLRLGKDEDPDVRYLFDPISAIGWPLQGGRTATRWRDEQLAALRSAFTHVAGEHQHRWASVGAISDVSGLPLEAVEALAKLTNLTVHAGFVFDGRLKTADARRALTSRILSCADRALHLAEVLEEAIARGGFGSDSPLREMHIAMSDDPTTFATDGRAMWQLRSQLGDVVEDRRPEHPPLPLPMSGRTLDDALTTLAQSRLVPREELLAGLDPDPDHFIADAGSRLAAALSKLPQTERCSIAQILNPDDEVKLIDWLRWAALRDAAADAITGLWSPRILEGLTMLAAFSAVIRANCGSDDALWTAILNACGEGTRGRIFNSQQAPRRQTLARMVEVAVAFRLRRAFSFRSDPWSTFLSLQAGLLRSDLDALPRWLSSSQPPVALRQLVAPGSNHSASMACAWNALQAYRRGVVGREALGSMSRQLEWWPGWSLDDVCRAVTTSLPDYSSPSQKTYPTALGIEDKQQSEPRSGLPAIYERARVAMRPNSKQPFGTLDVELDQDGNGFAVALPDSLLVSAGPVAMHGEGFRIGGEVHEDGSVRWHPDQRRVRLGLRGAAERVFRLERAGEVLETQSVWLWAPDDYFLAFPLAASHIRGFDPFLSPLPRTGGLALLLHHSLSVSVAPDDEHSLDGIYVLKIFRPGLPVGTTVSREGEVLWEAEQQSEPRRVAIDMHADLRLDSTSARWGMSTDLILPRALSGFIPYRANIGGQRLAAQEDGSTWRFPGFKLLPGMDALRRRGRLDGFMDGERVCVPATLSLARAPDGAVLRDHGEWRPLEPTADFFTARDGRARLWIHLPEAGEIPDWIVFEGPRPVLAYREQGVVLDRKLLGLGEELAVAPRRFNVNESSLPLAKLVTHTGEVLGGDYMGSDVRLRLTTPIGWTERHRALAWSEQGVIALVPTANPIASTEITFVGPDEHVDGVCLFHGLALLGSVILADDVAAATSLFLANAPGWPDTLRLAAVGRLPLLAPPVVSATLAKLRTDGGKGLHALGSVPASQASTHAIGRLLERWDAGRKLGEALLEGFLRAERDGSAQGTLLERLVAAAPCSMIRVLAHALQSIPKQERSLAMDKLIRCLVSRDTVGLATGMPPPRVASTSSTPPTSIRSAAGGQPPGGLKRSSAAG
jgi:hypothetical protein